ncbi:MAG: tetratricopeptide repeat protein [Acetobacteraceae bacterium]
MSSVRTIRRSILLALSLLSACAASDPSSSAGSRSERYHPTGAFGNYLAGRFALANADADTAATDLLAVLAVNPRNPEVIQQAFIACVIAGRPEAEALARQLPPDSLLGQLVLANADAKAGRWKSAEQRFRVLPRQGPTQVLQPLLVAWTQQGEGRTDEAMATLRPLLEMQRFRGLFSLHAAMINDIAGRKQEAARYYQAAQGAMPEANLRVAEIMASWYARNGQAVEAQRALSEVSNYSLDASIALPAMVANLSKRAVARPTDGLAEAYLAFASALRVQNANDLAIMVLRLALDLRPDLTSARLIFSEILVAQQQPRAALRALAGVPESDPLSGIVRLRRAALNERMGRSDDAIRELREIAQDFPNSPVPDLQLGDIYRAKQRYPDAITAYDRAIARVSHPVPTDWVVYYHRGIALDRNGQWARSEADLTHALKLAPDQPLVLNYLGYSWAERGENLPRAREMIEKALQRRPNDGAITDSLGWVLFRMGDIKEAVRLLERAVELEPDDPTINGHLGDAYWAVGRRIEAQYQWRRALTMNPTADDAAKLEAKLRPGLGSPVVTGQ